MCEGFLLQEQEEWKRVRAAGWVVLCVNCDPKKLPASMEVWWPIGNEKVVFRKFDREAIKKAIKRERGEE